MLLISTSIHRLDASINAVDGDLRWSKPDNRTKFFMCSLNSPVILHPEALPKHPYWRNGGTPMRIGDLGKWRHKGRVDNSFI